MNFVVHLLSIFTIATECSEAPNSLAMEPQKLESGKNIAEDTSNEAGEAATIDSNDIAKVLDHPQEQSSNSVEENLTREHSISTPLDKTRKENSTGHKARDDVSFSIKCRDELGKWSQPYCLPVNPFDDYTLGKQKPSAPMVIEIFIEVNGLGPTCTWDKNSFRPQEGMGHADHDETSDRTSDQVNDHKTPLGTQHGQHTSNGPKIQNNLTRALDSSYFRPLFANVCEIKIRSQNLIRILRAVVGHYPGHVLGGACVSVRQPFSMIAHYFDELSDLKRRCDESSHTKARVLKYLLEPNQGPSGAKPEMRTQWECDEIIQAAFYDLDVLLGYYKHELLLHVRKLETKFKLGLVSYPGYPYLWLLFKPGSIVYAWVGGKLAGFIFERKRELNDGGRVRMQVSCWNLSYNGHRVVRHNHFFEIDPFQGDKEMTELPIFPSKYYDNHEKAEACLQELGEKFYGIVRDCPAHLQYSGPCWENVSREEYHPVNTNFRGDNTVGDSLTVSVYYLT
jgi:hypothetical protein